MTPSQLRYFNPYRGMPRLKTLKPLELPFDGQILHRCLSDLGIFWHGLITWPGITIEEYCGFDENPHLAWLRTILYIWNSRSEKGIQDMAILLASQGVN